MNRKKLLMKISNFNIKNFLINIYKEISEKISRIRLYKKLGIISRPVMNDSHDR